ncbi:glycosyltransferase [Pedobacter heparinus]|uniref:glycosyltransferase n=1 Tax=Pedobacter heparinus TaxID=984 RepID=UPI00292FD285|nr:glycosyltransferase [Pedobacter heparinus]
MKQKILFITPGLFKGGAETQLLKVARFFKSKQHEVMVISLKPINSFGTELEKEGISVLYLKNWSTHFVSNGFTLFKALGTYRADVVIAFMFIAIIFARLLKIWFRFKLISTIRISVIKKKWYLLFKMTRGLDDAVVYNSYSSKVSFENQKLVLKEGIVINNSVDIPAIKSNGSPLRQSKPFVWICIAHFKYNKDYPTLFKAMSLIKGNNVLLQIVGNLHNQSWPHQMIKALKIQESVQLLGHKHNPESYLAVADAFVLSSFCEGMSNSLMEAMAYAKPIVATDISCNKELVEGAACGFLSKQEDAEDLARQMSEVMNYSLQERAILGSRGRQYIATNFSEEKVMQDWQAVINQVTKNQAIHTSELSAIS